ncbi:type VII secretion integral membrane protein EccD [Mycobacteriaceae bacterium 1482268.1]|nr:type VII secretion integral membrane protein EccD [Mycobacteriaceae bacterium 1482268.1]
MTVVGQCRVTVRMHGGGAAAAVDLTIPMWVELGEILPQVVDLFDEQSGGTGTDFTGRWTLSRLDGSPLDESMSLNDNGVRDGDVLILTTETTPVPYLHDLSHYVADASPPPDDGVSRGLGPVAGVWSVGFGAALLAVPGPTAPGIRAIVAAVVALSATAAAVVYDRMDADLWPTVSLTAGAVAMGAVAGYLMVPGGPAPPNFFLGAVVCTALSTSLLHLTSRGTPMLAAIAALSAMVAVVTAVVAVWPAPTAAVGAALAAASLAMLGVAAKLSIILTGLAPRMPETSDALDTDRLPAAVGAIRAARGHDMATGLLAGFSLSAALGTVLVAADRHDGWNGVALTGVVSAALLFRVGQQRGAIRTAVSFTAGMISATAAFTLAAALAPQRSVWLVIMAIALGVGGSSVILTDVGSRLSPFARRGLEIVDYLALAAVVPLACWVAGLFGVVRGLSLT